LVRSGNLDYTPSSENLASLIRFGVLTVVKPRWWMSSF